MRWNVSLISGPWRSLIFLPSVDLDVGSRRFHGGLVVVHASSKVKSGGRDLQLPSMSTLTSKTSSQHFFLRTLKAIIHLRDAARAAAEKERKQGMVWYLRIHWGRWELRGALGAGNNKLQFGRIMFSGTCNFFENFHYILLVEIVNLEWYFIQFRLYTDPRFFCSGVVFLQMS